MLDLLAASSSVVIGRPSLLLQYIALSGRTQVCQRPAPFTMYLLVSKCGRSGLGVPCTPLPNDNLSNARRSFSSQSSAGWSELAMCLTGETANAIKIGHQGYPGISCAASGDHWPLQSDSLTVGHLKAKKCSYSKVRLGRFQNRVAWFALPAVSRVTNDKSCLWSASAKLELFDEESATHIQDLAISTFPLGASKILLCQIRL